MSSLKGLEEGPMWGVEMVVFLPSTPIGCSVRMYHHTQ